MYRTKTSIKKSKKGRYHNSNTTKNSRTRTRRRTRRRNSKTTQKSRTRTHKRNASQKRTLLSYKDDPIKCIFGGPQVISILTKENKKIMLIGEYHLTTSGISTEKKEHYKKLIQKSIDKGCNHIYNILLRLIKTNRDRNFDLFIEMRPDEYSGYEEIVGSGGIKSIIRLKKTNNLSNLRLHWGDLRGEIEKMERQQASYKITQEELKQVYGISDDNLFWDVFSIKKLKKNTNLIPLWLLQFKNKKISERNLTRLNARWEEFSETYIDVLKTFTENILNDSDKVKRDFKSIMLHLFYNLGIDKISKQWKGKSKSKSKSKSNDIDKYSIGSIFFNSTWDNYIRKSLVFEHGVIMQKIVKNDINMEDFSDILDYINLVVTIMFAAVLDYYILGRTMKDYIHDNIIIYTGSAHTRNYIDILTSSQYGYSEVYRTESSVGTSEKEFDILEYNEKKLFKYF
jgi:hypothetical protein